MSKRTDGLLMAAEASVVELEEVQAAIAEGKEHGFLSAEVLAATVEEADLSSEQAHDLLSYLEEHGIEIVTPESAGNSALSEAFEPVEEDDAEQDDEPLEAREEEQSEVNPLALRTRLEELRKAEV